jgi:hypothetical protein
MTTRRKKIKLRAYDYMEGMRLVVERMKERGEDGKMDNSERSRVDVAIEVAADLGLPTAQAEALMRDLADSIIADRDEPLFMGDETGNPNDAEVAA